MNKEIKFKTKRNFLGFVTSLKGKIRLNQKTAYIDSDAFTKSFDKVKLKFTVCEDGLEVEQIDSNQFSRDMIQRFVDEICDGEVIGYAEKFVIKSLNFYTDELDICHLEVDHQKPIDRLFSIFEDVKNDKLVSEKGMSILDELFGDDEDDVNSNSEDLVNIKEINDSKTKESISKSYMEESFKKMRDEKILDLKSKADNKLKEIKLIELDINNSQSKLQNCIEELNILNSRIESFNEKDPELGIVFNVSQENKSEIKPDETLVNVIEKISPILKLNKNVLIDILTKGYYTIKFADKDNLNNKEFEIGVENLKKVTSIDPLGKFTIESPQEIRYYGDMTWHKIVNILINKGFEQSPEFDKICESNSYKSESTLD